MVSAAAAAPIAAGGERPAFALDHQHANIVIGLDFGAELLEFLGDRQVDRIEGGGPVERDGGDCTFDPEQGRIAGSGGWI